MAISDDIKSKIDLVDLVSNYVPLQKSGRSFKGICPFHAEKTPSFFVFPERQTWRCFGACATGGDIFNFVMQSENLSFVEALRNLSHQAGIPLQSSRKVSEHEHLYGINQIASNFFQRRLSSSLSVSAQKYLEDRGFTSETIDSFLLGFSPTDGQSLMNYMISNGYTTEQLATVGLITSANNGEYQDLFRGRLMFPIKNLDGKIAGFGGRSLGDIQPKYVNSPTTPIFDKGRILYSFDLAKESIKSDGVVIVEGYTDVIMAHQNKFTNVVCPMGTALTSYQTAILTKIAPQVTLAMDPDTAGQEATFRSLQSSWRIFQRQVIRMRDTESGKSTEDGSLYFRNKVPDLKVASLPSSKDPAELIRDNPDIWSEIVSKALPVMDYLGSIISSRIDLSTAEGKSQGAEIFSHFIVALDNPIAQDHELQKLSSLLSVSRDVLEASLGKPWAARRTKTANRPKASPSPFSKLDHDPLEQYCISLLLHFPKFKAFSKDITPDLFTHPENREVFTWWTKCSTIDELREGLDKELTDQLDRILSKPLPPANSSAHKKSLEECVQRLKERQLRERKSEEELRLSQANLEDLSLEEVEILKLNKSILQLFTNKE